MWVVLDEAALNSLSSALISSSPRIAMLVL